MGGCSILTARVDAGRRSPSAMRLPLSMMYSKLSSPSSLLTGLLTSTLRSGSSQEDSVISWPNMESIAARLQGQVVHRRTRGRTRKP